MQLKEMDALQKQIRSQLQDKLAECHINIIDLTAQNNKMHKTPKEDVAFVQMQQEVAAARAAVAASASGGEKEAALQGRLKEVEGLLAVEAAGRADADARAAAAAKASADADAKVVQLQRDVAAAREAVAVSQAAVAAVTDDFLLQERVAHSCSSSNPVSSSFEFDQSSGVCRVHDVGSSTVSGSFVDSLRNKFPFQIMSQGSEQHAVRTNFVGPLQTSNSHDFPATSTNISVSISKSASSVFGSLFDKLKSEAIMTADTQVVNLERDDKGFGLIMDLVHFDGMGVKLHDCRENSPAAICGLIQSGHRLVMIDDVDVTDLSAEQVLDLLQSKKIAKFCLKTQTAAQSHHDSKAASATKISSNEHCIEANTTSTASVSKAATIFGKFKSASSFFSSNPANSPATLPADSESIDRKKIVR